MNKIPKAELKAILLAYGEVGDAKAEKINAAANAEQGLPTPTDPRAAKVKVKARDLMAGLMADRMLAGKELFTVGAASDLDTLISTMIQTVVEEGPEMSAEEVASLTKFFKISSQNMVDALKSVVPAKRDPYDFQWLMVNTIRRLAEEKGRNPSDIVFLEEIGDEITATLYSKEELEGVLTKAFAKLTDVDLVIEALMQPLITALTEGEPTFSDEDRAELVSEIRPKLAEALAKQRVFYEKWVKEEIARIYG